MPNGCVQFDLKTVAMTDIEDEAAEVHAEVDEVIAETDHIPLTDEEDIVQAEVIAEIGTATGIIVTEEEMIAETEEEMIAEKDEGVIAENAKEMIAEKDEGMMSLSRNVMTVQVEAVLRVVQLTEKKAAKEDNQAPEEAENDKAAVAHLMPAVQVRKTLCKVVLDMKQDSI
jgi:hypothetical protein